MPGAYNRVVLNLPGKAIGALVVGILRPLGYSAIRLSFARKTAQSVFNAVLYSGLRRLVFPAVQSRLPIRTRRLKRSFRMTRDGDNAVFTFVFYGQQKIIRPSRITMRRAVIEEFSKRGNIIIEHALQRALDAV